MRILRASSLDSLPSALTERLSFGSGVGFFESIDWFRCLMDANVFGNDQLVVMHSEAADWALVLRKGKQGEVSGLANYYSPEFGLCGSGRELEEDALASAVLSLAGPAGVAQFRGLKRGIDGVEALIEAFQGSRFAVYLDRQYTNWYQNVAGGSGESYLGERSSRLRNTIRRGWNKISRAGEARTLVIDGPSNRLGEHIRQFERVYARSWKPGENNPAFIPTLIRTCARLGNLRLGLFLVDGAVVAAQLWIRDGRTSHVYKLAHDPDAQRYSVGSILTARMFEHAIDEDGVEVIDFGMGDELYKRDWVSQQRPIECMNVFDPRRPLGAARLVKRGLGDLYRRLRLINH